MYLWVVAHHALQWVCVSNPTQRSWRGVATCAPGGLDVAIRQPPSASISVLDWTGNGERQQPSIINPVINFSTHLWPVKWNALGYTFALRIPFHLLQCRCNTCTNTINNDMIHFISSRDHIGSSILTSLAFSPLPSSIGAKSCSSFIATWSIAPKPPTCPSCLQPVHQAKSCLDLLHLDHMTQCHVSCAMSSFIIICVSFATSPNHFHLHGICCSHTCTCGLITCVSHINIISPHRVVTQLSKPNKNLSILHAL